MSNPLDSMKIWHFVVDGGMYIVEGKSYHPDMIRVELPRNDAFVMIAMLARALDRQELRVRNGEEPAGMTIDLPMPWFGTLTQEYE